MSQCEMYEPHDNAAAEHEEEDQGGGAAVEVVADHHVGVGSQYHQQQQADVRRILYLVCNTSGRSVWPPLALPPSLTECAYANERIQIYLDHLVNGVGAG